MARPLGKTHIPKIRDFLGKDDIQKLTDKAVEKAKAGNEVMLKFLLEQVYGRAQQNVDLTTGGDKIIPILNGISTNNSNKEVGESEKTNTGNSGGNIGIQDDFNSTTANRPEPERQDKEIN